MEMSPAVQVQNPPAWRAALDRIGLCFVVGLAAAYILFLLAVWWYVYFRPADLF